MRDEIRQDETSRDKTIPTGRGLGVWRCAGVHAGWITLLVLGLFYAWFGVANRYITAAANFFARTPALQLLTFLVAGGLVYAATRRSSLVNPPS
ncbi:MAG: hypothetical protein IT329_20115 [Caldilineaceae bacterium]|nr:hypothetical protein [Caldilineaceae bacterium]